MDWLARLMAWATFKIPRIAPSRWSRFANRRRGNDLISEWFTVKADDGVSLDAVYFPPQERPLDVPVSRLKPASFVPGVPVVFAHGWTETKEFHIRIARVLTAAGHPVILFDQRGHGSSEGKYSTLGVLEQHDLRAVIDEGTRRGWIADRVITMGVSMGASAALCQAASDARVAGVVAFAPFSRFTDAIRSYQRRYARWFSADWAIRGFKQFCSKLRMDIDQAAPLEAMGRIQVPVLFIVGTRDVNLPAEDHTQPLIAAADGIDCRFVAAAGANHFNVVSLSWPGVDEAVMQFLSRHSAIARPMGNSGSSTSA